jgi:hypothetical protein
MTPGPTRVTRHSSGLSLESPPSTTRLCGRNAVLHAARSGHETFPCLLNGRPSDGRASVGSGARAHRLWARHTVVVTKQRHSPNPAYNLRTDWADSVISWIRTDSAEPQSTVASPRVVKLEDGAVFITGALIPVAVDEPNGPRLIQENGAVLF